MAKKPQAKKVETIIVESATSKNRKARLERHLKKHPNDVQAQKASTSTKAPRKAPKVKGVHPKQKFKLRDASGKVIGLANFSTFDFANAIFIQNDEGKLVENPEIRQAWNRYKSLLVNAKQYKYKHKALLTRGRKKNK